MKLSIKALILAAFAVLLLLAGRRWGVASVDVVPSVDTVFVDKPLPSRDTVRVEIPRTHVVYRTVRDTIRISVPVPRGFSPMGLLPRRPLRFDGRQAVLTYWSPSAVAFVQDRYRLPRPKWGAHVAVRALLWPERGLGVEAAVRYRQVGLFAQADAYADDYRLTAGVRVFAWGR